MQGEAERVARGSQRLASFVDALLTFATADQRSDGKSQLDEVVGSLLPTLAGSERVEVKVPGDLTVGLAPPLLESVLDNLLSNALKYGLQKPVTLQARREDGRVVLWVEDRGVGMRPDEAARAFDLFYRAPGRAEPGTGLGLSTVKRIVEAHGGTVEVRSAPGEGSTFTITLPSA
jgi:signal transduction histidine kinase